MRPEGHVADAELIVDPDTYTSGVPHDALTRLREKNVVRIDDFWAVFRYDDVRTVLKTPAVFSSHRGATQIRDPQPDDLKYVQRMMLNQDPPEHTRLRRMLTRAFTPRAVARLEEGIRANAREIVANLSGDFAVDVADLPLLTLADVFGVPRQDRALLYDWSNRVIGFQDSEYALSSSSTAGMTDMALEALQRRPDDGRDPRARDGMPDLYAYAHALGEYKRAHPGDDVLSNLMREDISIEEFENLFWLFSVAGNETLRNGIPGGMIALLEHPDQYERLRNDRSLLPTAVEEMLRWWTPVMHFRRTAVQDTELSGQKIKAGDKVVVWFSSANRDERVFTEPMKFDVGRREADHLSFGHGPHFCLGAQLARTQMRAIFEAVLDLSGTIQLDGPVDRLRSNFQNGVKHLPVRGPK
ncbi:cytochrome P450 [Lentzea flava]|uniref:Cytochrome P450 n=1 Tax=Lentzea flava TaxID=103732 RepID=A0ABQ2V5X6_9PSEU|nr:cytochrome P450 [Lentzea flava]MCP2203477.1 Cytochrome P450 [Lentzea flava]GGU67661.1 cytochrome P450 [Lentzea flava]